MAYDGSGRRISKTRLCKVDDNAWETAQVTHYTGIGTEVLENFHNGSLNNTKIDVNIPMTLPLLLAYLRKSLYQSNF
ncbi:MAG: hypothetical protein HUK20_04455 [Fibrobacter sp.]|nr:hypothetical protein [Fibrobacter sp.]